MQIMMVEETMKLIQNFLDFLDLFCKYIMKDLKKNWEEVILFYFFESFGLLHYNLHKISLNRGASYIDSPDWLKIKMQK